MELKEKERTPQEQEAFAAIKFRVAQIMFNKLRVSENGQTIEANPASHEISEWFFQRLKEVRQSEAIRAAGIVEALREINEYLSHETYENGKPNHLNNVGAFSILHKKAKAALEKYHN